LGKINAETAIKNISRRTRRKEDFFSLRENMEKDGLICLLPF